MKYYHEILAGGENPEACRRKVLHFFERYKLVKYSRIDILEGKSIPASDALFNSRLAQAVATNRRILNKLIAELEQEGITILKEIDKIQQGYQSKMLHSITHFVDGFFGIDSYFYNLEEDSHWVSDGLRGMMEVNPSYYRLFSLQCRILEEDIS
jgi:hypothetical protein